MEKYNLNKRRILTMAVVIFAVFMLSGGFSAVLSYAFGASSYLEYRESTTAPLFAGCLMIGAFGLLYAYKNRQSPLCLMGFVIALFCYGFIEYLFTALGGI